MDIDAQPGQQSEIEGHYRYSDWVMGMAPANKTDNRSPGGEELCVDLERDLLKGLDAYAATFRENLSRTDAVQRILREWLCAQGYVRMRSAGSTRPEDLNSANDD
jgi:hypothetical protein